MEVTREKDKKEPKRLVAEKVESVGSEKAGGTYSRPMADLSQGPLVKFLIKHRFTLFVILYVLSPIDFIFDFIPVIGYLDDAGLVLMLVDRIMRSWQSKQK